MKFTKFEMKENTLRVGKKYISPFGVMFVVAIIWVAVLSACGQANVQPLRYEAAPWSPNEVSIYQLTDMNGNYAGTARYDLSLIDGTIDGLAGEVWNLRREINAQGMQEIVVVDMNTSGFRPQQSTLLRIDNSGTEVVTTQYSGSDANLELTTKQNITTIQRISIPSDAREQTSLVMLLRALPLAADYAVRMNIFSPVVGTLDRVTVQTVRQENVTVPAGTFDTWLVRLETPNSKTEAWVSTQAPYQVVKFVDSRNGGVFELSEFQPGQ